MKRLRGFLGVFLIFFFGVVVGAALTGGTIWKEMHDIIEGGPDAVVAKISGTPAADALTSGLFEPAPPRGDHSSGSPRPRDLRRPVQKASQ